MRYHVILLKIFRLLFSNRRASADAPPVPRCCPIGSPPPGSSREKEKIARVQPQPTTTQFVTFLVLSVSRGDNSPRLIDPGSSHRPPSPREVPCLVPHCACRTTHGFRHTYVAYCAKRELYILKRISQAKKFFTLRTTLHERRMMKEVAPVVWTECSLRSVEPRGILTTRRCAVSSGCRSTPLLAYGR